MNWLFEIFRQPSPMQSVMAVALVSGLGIYLGRLKFFGVSLGMIFVFFVGILGGHLGIVIESNTVNFIQSFGLILFVYTVGLQVGPSFFVTMKKGGKLYNLLGMGVLIFGVAITLIFKYTTDIPMYKLVGLLSGAVTNSPALGAGQAAYLHLFPGQTKGVLDMALACAVTYPLGAVGVMLIIVFFHRFLTNEKDFKKTLDTRSETVVNEYQVVNPAVYGKTIDEIGHLSNENFVISRIWRHGEVLIPTSKTVLNEHDYLHLVSLKNDVDKIKLFFGELEVDENKKPEINWQQKNPDLISQQVVITKNKVNGVRLGNLRLRNLYGINITRISRAGIILLASRDLHLQLGDKLTIVGEKESVKNVVKILGDQIKKLDKPNLISVFIGITLGLILGSIPISIPGLEAPVRLGLAGGPIVVGILMGAFGSRFHFTTYTTLSANLMMREFGITIYFAGLGLQSGGKFVETMFCAEGLHWVGIGAAMTLIPVLLIAFISKYVYKLNFSQNMGMVTASMASPMGLSYVNSVVDNDEPSVVYATVYPFLMFARVITAQILIFIFS
ncbi:MAG: putative transporter [Massilibacteroides sp.]|nr:putative transporter [Massilibacteroides sp.]